MKLRGEGKERRTEEKRGEIILVKGRMRRGEKTKLKREEQREIIEERRREGQRRRRRRRRRSSAVCISGSPAGPAPACCCVNKDQQRFICSEFPCVRGSVKPVSSAPRPAALHR